MNQATRDAVLRGVSGAAEMHDAFRTREAYENGLRAIDVFDAITDLQIPLVFEALDELLGACVRVNSAAVGILVTTRRDLHMQRFTAAHELGHFVLGHEGSLDREVRMPGHTIGRDIQEVEADAFAAEFLMPKWLVKAAAQRRTWWGQDPCSCRPSFSVHGLRSMPRKLDRVFLPSVPASIRARGAVDACDD